MSWNGAGTYVLPAATFPEVNGTVIDANRYNPTLNDVASGITNTIAKDGQNVPTANLPMGGFKHTGAIAATTSGEYLLYGQGAAGFGNGTAAAPSITFASDTNTGLFRVSADTLGVTTGGGQRAQWDSTAMTLTVPAYVPAGAVGTPSLTTAADPDTGVWFPASADTLGIAIGGTQAARWNSDGALLLGSTDGGSQISRLNILQGSGRCISMYTVSTDATNKAGRIGVRHYLAAEEDMTVIGGSVAVASNSVQVGGGSSTLNAATEVQIYAAANNTTLTGTQVAGFTSTAFTLSAIDTVLADVDPTSTLSAGFRGSPVVTFNNTQAFSLTHAGKTMRKSNTTAYTWTINAEATTNFPIGTVINLLHDSTAGNITLARGGGVALINGTTDGDQTITAGTLARIQKIAADRWRYTT